MLDVVLGYQAVDMSLVQREFEVAYSNCGNAIGELVEIGVLDQVNEDRSNRPWVAPEVIAKLDEFAERAKRSTFIR